MKTITISIKEIQETDIKDFENSYPDAFVPISSKTRDTSSAIDLIIQVVTPFIEEFINYLIEKFKQQRKSPSLSIETHQGIQISFPASALNRYCKDSLQLIHFLNNGNFIENIDVHSL